MPHPRDARFRPVSEIARTALPGQERERATVAEVAAPTPVERAWPQLTITADITLPLQPQYARRLAALLAELRESLEEDAPWLDNVTIDVRR